MFELFEVQKSAISKHLKNIFKSGELLEESVVSKMETTAADGKRYNTNYYNLDAFLQLNEEDVLQDRAYQSDFDRLVVRTEENNE